MARGVTFKIKEKFSIIHTCECGIRFIEIQAEIDVGYKRECCPWCKPYPNRKPPPPLTHLQVPENLKDFKSMVYKD